MTRGVGCYDRAPIRSADDVCDRNLNLLGRCAHVGDDLKCTCKLCGEVGITSGHKCDVYTQEDVDAAKAYAARMKKSLFGELEIKEKVMSDTHGKSAKLQMLETLEVVREALFEGTLIGNPKTSLTPEGLSKYMQLIQQISSAIIAGKEERLEALKAEAKVFHGGVAD